jgi:small multidrug resistance pump
MLLLFLAIVCEVVATASLKAAQGFTRPLFVVLVVVGYGAALYLLSLSLRHIPLGVAYAIWSGVGTVGTVLVGMLVWQEVLTLPRAIGILLIIVGVILLNVFQQAPVSPTP